jgi:hypothetical protein
LSKAYLISLVHLWVAENERPEQLIQLYLVYLVAGASDFPHSRQDDLERGVINPQNGHILCDAKPRAGGVIDANSFAKDALNAVNRLRNRSLNCRKAIFIVDLPSIFLTVNRWSRHRVSDGNASQDAHCPHLSQANDDMRGIVILCKIAHTRMKCRS